MDLVLLSLSVLGLAASAACIVVGVYLLRHPDKRPRIALKFPLSSREEEEKPGNFLEVLRKAEAGLEAKQE